MGKKIIIDSEDVEVKNVSNKTVNNNLINNGFFSWFIYTFFYSLVLIIVSLMFDSFYINLNYFGIYAFIASVIMYMLNKTIKPILKFLTLPINILTMGLTYPIVNVIILEITSLIIGHNNLNVSGFFAPFIVVIFISLLNVIMEGLIIKPIVNGRK